MNRIRFVLIILAAGAILCGIAGLAIAQTPPAQPTAPMAHCGPLSGILKYLREHFNQHRIWWTTEEGQFSIHITRSPITGEFTIIKGDGDQACIVQIGTSSEADHGI